MYRLLILSAIFISSSCAASLGQSEIESHRVYTIYVSASGDDAADGSSAEVAGIGAGPVRTLDRAKQLLAQALSNRESQPRQVIVVLRGGRYELNAPLILGPEISGNRGAPVIFRSYPGEIARISGGRRMGNWRHKEGRIWAAPTESNSCPYQLFVAGERRERPRRPATGFFRIDRVAEIGANGPQPNDQFFARRDDLPDLFDAGRDAEVVVFSAWTASRMRLKTYDPSTGLISLSGKFMGHGLHTDMTVGLPFYIENSPISALAEKTWRCDPENRELLYRPGRDEVMEEVEVVVPQTPQLLVIRGRSDAPVHDIRFENLVLEHSAWSLPPEGWAAMQAEVGLPAAVEINYARDIALSDFAILHTGANAIAIRAGTASITITGGELRDIGGSGISIGLDQRKPIPGTFWSAGATSRFPVSDILVENTLIASVGRLHWAGVGVWIGQADHVTVRRNEIRDLYYTGISLGWTWTYGDTLGHDNRIVGNLVRDYGQGVLSDFGGIYTLGRQSNSLVTENLILNGNARDYGGHGLYADAATSGVLFQNNVVTGVSHAGIHVHYGADLLFQGNVLLNFGEAGIRCTKPSQGPVVFRKNHLAGGPSALFGVCGDPSYVFDSDVWLPEPKVPLRLQKSSSEKSVKMFLQSSDDRGAADADETAEIVPDKLTTARNPVAMAKKWSGRLTPSRLTVDME